MFRSSLTFINLKGGSSKYFSFCVTFLEKLLREKDFAHFRHDEIHVNKKAF